jgi:hypothetical protein
VQRFAAETMTAARIDPIAIRYQGDRWAKQRAGLLRIMALRNKFTTRMTAKQAADR